MKVSADTIHDVLLTILDPEMPINIVDLGIVTDVRLHPQTNPPAVDVDITPTFVGCPALDVLRQEVELKMRGLGIQNIKVRFVNDPPWSVDRISDAGRESLRKHGVTVPARGSLPLRDSVALQLTVHGSPFATPCPYCGSNQTHMESRFGPTRCRMIYYCESCRNQFEHMKPV